MNKESYPITEFFSDKVPNLEAFFANGKKEFWKFDQIKKKGIDKCLFFFPRHFEELKNITKKCKLIYEFKSASTISPVYLYDNKVLIALCPLGGPAAANLMEELIYVGIKYFIGTGTCGAIEHVENYDTYLLPKAAIRDEGVSYHYLPASRLVKTSTLLQNSLKSVLKAHGEKYVNGLVWTTDALYRESPECIAARRTEGATGVEMETASLAAVAKARKVEYACLLYYSDYNDGLTWETRIYNRVEVREEIINLCVEALLTAGATPQV